TVLFSSNRNGPWNVFTMPFDGSSPARQVTRRNDWTFAYSRSPDGRFVTIDGQRPETGEDILIADTDSWRMEPFQVTPFAERSGAFSPDGKWIAYECNESGRDEIYVRPFRGTGKWLVSV